MNEKRRTSIRVCIVALNGIKEAITSQHAKLSDILYEEESALDNIPESFRDTDRYTSVESAVDALDNVSSNLDDVIDTINDVIEELSTVL